MPAHNQHMGILQGLVDAVPLAQLPYPLGSTYGRRLQTIDPVQR